MNQKCDRDTDYAIDSVIDSAIVPLAERFVSINGEGQQAGKLACFIRFPQCNLRCSYCDTMWANDPQGLFEEVSIKDLADWVASTNVLNVTITGGEPLLQPALPDLLRTLDEVCPNRWIELETNGSQSLDEYTALRKVLTTTTLSFTMDWKSPSSGMSEMMRADNLLQVTQCDTVKFVVGNRLDLDYMRNLCVTYDLFERTQVFLSPVSGVIDPAEIVAYMQHYDLNRARLQLQLHKIIWPHEVKGV